MNGKNLRRLKKVFYALIVTFILTIVMKVLMNYQTGMGIRRIMILVSLTLGILFFLLGIILVVLTLKSKVKGKLKAFLLLTGIAPVGLLISAILHNVNLFADFWIRIGIEDEPFFFIMWVFVCPIVFLIGVIGSIVLFKRKGGRHSSHR